MFSRKKKNIRLPDFPNPVPDLYEKPECKHEFEVQHVEIIEDWDYPLLKDGQSIGKAKVGILKIASKCMICGAPDHKVEWNALIHALVEID